ncbi:hypothetical protein ABFS82_14G228100 [Erythranthe guttata]|uniref:axial regulator YABBY 5-like n=1 Tax=Erythranthe guttata TaxID=4155 RepID=UPI00064DF3AB|nr:PREDICTED: axial regulator YABBY 5-like [Erythranthe guttata]|eukprot:XP_012838499.1 PREDICTED: axial regulator YABBY 5-like [Erythranthe guttata]
MSVDAASERVCYVHCNFCNTVLAVSVPCSSMLSNIVRVRCGHCSNLLSVNMGSLLHSLHLQDTNFQKQPATAGSSSTTCKRFGSLMEMTTTTKHHEQRPTTTTTPKCPPLKRQRVPSAYNRFIKEEIQRIKASNPEMRHREAFSTAAKNWAHFPDINNYGLKLGANKLAKLDHHADAAGGDRSTHRS